MRISGDRRPSQDETRGGKTRPNRAAASWERAIDWRMRVVFRVIDGDCSCAKIAELLLRLPWTTSSPEPWTLPDSLRLPEGRRVGSAKLVNAAEVDFPEARLDCFGKQRITPRRYE